VPYDLEFLIRDLGSSTIVVLTYAFWSQGITGVGGNTAVTVIGETIVLDNWCEGSTCSYVGTSEMLEQVLTHGKSSQGPANPQVRSKCNSRY